MGAYRELSALLREDNHRILARSVTSAQRVRERRKKVAREAEKKAFELARYVGAGGAFTSMVHTLSGTCCTACGG